MKIIEVIEPKKPEKVYISKPTDQGFYGNQVRVYQKQFVTKQHNTVDVKFVPGMSDGRKNITIMFYVNNAMTSYESKKDPEIFPHVLYIIKQYLKYSKTNYVSFSAYSDDKDRKIKYNLPIQNEVNVVLKKIPPLIQRINNTHFTQDEIDQAMLHHNKSLQRFNKPPETSFTILYKKELLTILNDIKQIVTTLEPTDEKYEHGIEYYYSMLNKYGRTANTWSEYDELMGSISNLHTKLLSYKSHGTVLISNRRFNIYEKLVNHYLQDEWIIHIDKPYFELERKHKR